MFGIHHFQPRTFIQVGCWAFLLSVILTPITIFLLRRFGIVDKVSDDKLHNKPIPRGGGIAIFLAFAIAVLIPNYREDAMNGVIIGAFICLVVGAIDDIWGVPAVIKLLTLCAVTVILSYFDVSLNLFKGYPILDLLLTMLWIVGVTSAFNGMDNMDGLASGTAAIVSTIYVFIAVQAYIATRSETSLSWFGLLSVGLVGANLGFLIFNSHPARVFMGDSGSFFLGFTVAALGVMGEWADNRIVSCAIPVLILGVPICDFAYVLVSRILKGQTRDLRSVIEHCALDHLSHRLMWIGFTQRTAVFFIYFVTASLGITGILLRNSRSLIEIALAMFQGLAILAIIAVLMAAVKDRHLCMLNHELARLKEEWRQEEEAKRKAAN